MFNKLLYATISSRGKEAVRRLSHRLSSKPLGAPFLQTRTVVVRPKHEHILRNEFPLTKSTFNTDFITNGRGFSTDHSTVALVTTISLLALGPFMNKILKSLLVLKMGDHPILHEPAREVHPEEIGSESIQEVIDTLVTIMRMRNLVSLSAPQIGAPLQIIALDKFPVAHPPKEDYESEDFDLLVIVNPKLKQKSNTKGLALENCASVPGYQAMEERFLEVEVSGLNQYGQPIKVDASGWHARVLQHECDHLDGILYVDKMVKETFTTRKNLYLSLVKGS